MRATRLTFAVVVALISLLQACATAPPASEPVVSSQPSSEPEPEPGTVPELTLNLPSQANAQCPCEPPKAVDRTFLDKGFAALAAGDHREAVNYFRRYQRLESSPGVDWEASIAVAYDKMMPDSPYFNWRAARESYLRLMREPPKGIQLHEQIILMRDALAVFAELHMRIDDLQRENGNLSESLEKREEALRRLRELTLGQKGAGL